MLIYLGGIMHFVSLIAFIATLTTNLLGSVEQEYVAFERQRAFTAISGIQWLEERRDQKDATQKDILFCTQTIGNIINGKKYGFSNRVADTDQVRTITQAVVKNLLLAKAGAVSDEAAKSFLDETTNTGHQYNGHFAVLHAINHTIDLATQTPAQPVNFRTLPGFNSKESNNLFNPSGFVQQTQVYSHLAKWWKIYKNGKYPLLFEIDPFFAGLNDPFNLMIGMTLDGSENSFVSLCEFSQKEGILGGTFPSDITSLMQASRAVHLSSSHTESHYSSSHTSFGGSLFGVRF